jgi:hypothetical protein
MFCKNKYRIVTFLSTFEVLNARLFQILHSSTVMLADSPTTTSANHPICHHGLNWNHLDLPIQSQGHEGIVRPIQPMLPPGSGLLDLPCPSLTPYTGPGRGSNEWSHD